MSAPQPPPPARGRNRVVIPATCRTCAGQMAIGFTNVVVSKLPDGQIEFDPHATGTHPFTVPEDAARRLVERVQEWLG